MRLRTVVVSVAVLACPARAAAQTTAPPTVPSANDVWIGSVASSSETAQAPFGPWLGSAGWSLATSHAWTDRWRTELTVARLGPATGCASSPPVSRRSPRTRNDQWTVRRTGYGHDHGLSSSGTTPGCIRAWPPASTSVGKPGPGRRTARRSRSCRAMAHSHKRPLVRCGRGAPGLDPDHRAAGRRARPQGLPRPSRLPAGRGPAVRSRQS